MADVLFYTGVLQLAVVFLSLAAGVIASMLYKVSSAHKELFAWKYVIFALLFFAVVEIIGVLDAFNIARSLSFLRHIIPSIIIGLLITAVVIQLQVSRVE